MKKVTVKKKMFYSLIIPYLAVGIVATLFLAYIYKSSTNTIKSEVIGNSYATLNKVVKEIDYLLENIQSLVIEIDSNTKFRKMLTIESDNRTKIDNYNIAMGIRELREIKKYNPFINNLALYYHKGDFCINVESLRTVEGFYKDFSFEEVTYEEWDQIITKQYDEGHIISIEEYMLYIVTIPINEPEEKLNIIVQIKDTGFRQIIEEHSSFNEGSLYILENKKNLVFSNEQEEVVEQKDYTRIVPKKKERTKRGVQYEEVSIDEKEYTMLRIEAENLELEYIWLIPNDKLAQKSYYVRNAFLGISIGFMVILLLGVHGVKNNYKQIQKIMERLSKNNVYLKTNKNNPTEVKFINNALDHLEEKIENRTDLLIEELFRKALYGLVEKEEEGYQVLMRKSPEYVKEESILAIFEPNFKKEVEDLKLNRFVLENIMEDVFKYEVMFRIIPLQKWEVVILKPLNVGEGNGMDYILDGLERIRAFLGNQLSLKYTVGVSSPIEGIERFVHGYREAMEALEEKVILGNNRMIYYGNLEEHKNGYYYEESVYNQMVNYIRVGQQDKALETLEKLFEINFREYQISSEQAKLLVLDILSTLLQVAKEIDYKMQLERIDVLKEKYTIQEIKEKVVEDIEIVCSKFSQSSTSIKDKVSKIIKYIEDNYHNMNLNVGMVAEYLDFNPSYLSRFFKEQTGDNLLNYINRYRVEKVKAYLMTTDKSLKLIAVETGFIDSNALSRTFKKYEGITPSQYKSAYIK